MIHKKDEYLKGFKGTLPRGRKKSIKKRPKGEKESSIQSKVEAYCAIKGLKFIRIPDTAYSVLFGSPGVPVHVKAILSSQLKGLPDITILKPSGAYNTALLMEIKKEGGKLSQGQKNWHKGANVAVCYGWDECKKEIDKFIEEG